MKKMISYLTSIKRKLVNLNRERLQFLKQQQEDLRVHSFEILTVKNNNKKGIKDKIESQKMKLFSHEGIQMF